MTMSRFNQDIPLVRFPAGLKKSCGLDWALVELNSAAKKMELLIGDLLWDEDKQGEVMQVLERRGPFVKLLRTYSPMTPMWAQWVRYSFDLNEYYKPKSHPKGTMFAIIPMRCRETHYQGGSDE